MQQQQHNLDAEDNYMPREAVQRFGIVLFLALYFVKLCYDTIVSDAFKVKFEKKRNK